MFNLYCVNVAKTTRHLVGGYKEKAAAEAQARKDAEAFKVNGKDEMHGVWWGSDAEGGEFRFFVEAEYFVVSARTIARLMTVLVGR
jgi:hypothetical protein